MSEFDLMIYGKNGSREKEFGFMDSRRVIGPEKCIGGLIRSFYPHVSEVRLCLEEPGNLKPYTADEIRTLVIDLELLGLSVSGVRLPEPGKAGYTQEEVSKMASMLEDYGIRVLH